jgi:hypothetical protein
MKSYEIIFRVDTEDDVDINYIRSLTSQIVLGVRFSDDIIRNIRRTSIKTIEYNHEEV